MGKFDLDKIDCLTKKVDEDAEQIDEIVSQIIKPYCEDLDMYVDFIRKVLADGDNQPTAQELDDFCLNLPVDRKSVV